jgi:hypothetical protein
VHQIQVCNGKELTSGSEDRRVTRGGASFLVKVDTKSESAGSISINFISTFTAESTTAALACARRGVILSQMLQTYGKISSFTSHCNSLIIYQCFSTQGIIQHPMTGGVDCEWSASNGLKVST